MQTTKVFRIGKLALHIDIENEFKSHFNEIESRFYKDKSFVSEKIFKIKFVRFCKRTSEKYRISDNKKKKIIQSFPDYHIKPDTPKGRLRIYPPLAKALKSHEFIDLVKKSKGLKSNKFFIRQINKSWLLALDLPTRKGLLLYLPFKKKPVSNIDIHAVVAHLIENLIPELSSFVLHASAVKIDRKGYLFLGESGAGKSTIAKILIESIEDAKLVSDDAVVITPGKNSLKFYASPLQKDRKGFAKNIIGSRRVSKININRIYFVHKSKKEALTKCFRSDAFKEIMSKHIIMKTWFRDHHVEVSFNILKLLNKIPVRHLYFQKNPNFIKLILKK